MSFCFKAILGSQEKILKVASQALTLCAWHHLILPSLGSFQQTHHLLSPLVCHITYLRTFVPAVPSVTSLN